jgi:Glycoside hydrolase 123, N-terminal domain
VAQGFSPVREMLRRPALTGFVSAGLCMSLGTRRSLLSLAVGTLLLGAFSVPGRGAPGERVPYRTGTWDTEKLGNHRAVVRVSAPADAVWAHVPWRRRDQGPEAKNIIIVDGTTGARVGNIVRIDINREFGDLVFQPQTAPGDYYLYYLPYISSGRSNYPRVVYQKPDATPDAAWLVRNQLTPDGLAARLWQKLPRAEATEFQAIDEFNSFYPMEVIATAEETRALVAKHPNASYLLFPEDRKYPIRMTDDLPERWIDGGAGQRFQGDAAPGEFYTFQVGIYAIAGPVENLTVGFSGLAARGTQAVIPASAFRCSNTGGTDWMGRAFQKAVRVERGKVQTLWVGVQIPDGAAPGEYKGTVTITPKGMESATVPVTLSISGDAIKATGDDEPWRHSRLRWLDSMLAVDDDLVPPYTPVEAAGGTIGVLGRRVSIGETGLPKSIQSLFTPEMTHLGDRPREVLAGPVRLVVESAEPDVAPWVGSGATFVRKGPGAVEWEAKSAGGPLTMQTHARMEFDGNIEFEVAIRAARQTVVSDIRLEIPVARDVARYMMGMGLKGGLRPAGYHWAWNIENNQDSAWIGDINAGLQFTLKDDKYSRPLNTNFYHSKPLVMPASWDNRGKGGCRFTEQGASFLAGCYSGPRVIHQEELLRYDFRLLVTPFRPLDTKAQFGTRYFHAYKSVAEVVATGANTVNIHHANAINPWINYPFLTPKEMKAYVDEAHAKGLKVKIYYTVRELSNRAPELFALRSLGDEVLSYGPGGGSSWLQEHLGSNYIAAWFVPELKDAAVINTGVSRWHNYYVEGLNWLTKNIGIDGLYIDDVAFDRTTMKRVRKILDRNRPGALIDLHSANQFNVRDGYANSANLYLEHFPYLNRLWFGEYFDYSSKPDFWLVEVSGIPFGLMGEMLEGGGNPWRGMVFGMTGRLPWSGDPRPLWRAWDAFGIIDSRMIGYWVPDSPVKTDNAEVLATTYARPGKAMVALASWVKEKVDVRLKVDWKALGIDPRKARVTAPAVAKFQEAATFAVTDPIPVEPAKGWLLVIDERP